MRKIHNKKGDMGVGALLIFIAIILTAAIAATVLILTTSDMQHKTLETGKESQDNIATHATIFDVTAENGVDGELNNLTVLVKLAAGSPAMNLNDTLVTVSLNNVTGNYRYNRLVDYDNTTQNVQFFNITYEVESTEHREGHLMPGDVGNVLIIPPRTIVDDEKVRISFIPRVGKTSLVDFRTPAVISKERVTLYP